MNVGFYYKNSLKKFFGRHISIKFLGDRNQLHKSNKHVSHDKNGILF